jgi:5-formyltetrahydrofolate cyclo-ligase
MAMHEPPEDWPEIKAWRKRTREELIARRLGWDAQLRRRRGRTVCERLAQLDELKSIDTFGIYWPIRGEIDVRGVAASLAEAGATIALPVVERKAAPLQFWQWEPGMAMQSGFWNIPIPAERRPVTPQVVLAPLVGFDRVGYRLGYGGGYFDRTLAAASPRPRVIGIGYADTRLETIYPQPHDIPMDAIITA